MIQHFFTRKYFYHYLTAIVLLTVFSLILLTYKDYGIVWDGPFHQHYGQLILSFFQSFGENREALRYFNLFLYGGFFDFWTAIWEKILPAPHYQSRHLFNALFGLAGTIGLFKVVQFLRGPRAAFFSVLLLITYPVYYGHIFTNPKDIPFATGYVWALYALLHIAKKLPEFSPKNSLRFVLLAGMCMGIRPGGILFICYLGAITLYYVWSHHHSLLSSFAKKIWLKVFLLSLGAWSVMVAFWPWALFNPIGRPIRSLRSMGSAFTDATVLFDSQLIPCTNLPRSYFFHLLGIQSPEIHLVLGSFALIAIPLALMRWQHLADERKRVWGTFLLATFFPILHLLIVHPPLYDNFRHFLFVIPLLIAGIAIAFEYYYQWIKNQWRYWGVAVVYFTFLVGMIFPIREMMRLHPYQYVYYNSLVGGLPGAHLRYETDYWGLAYKEAIEALTDYLIKAEGNENFYHKKYRIAVSGNPEAIAILFPPQFQLTTSREGADYFLGGVRFSEHLAPIGSPIITIQRLNTPLVVVKKIK